MADNHARKGRPCNRRLCRHWSSTLAIRLTREPLLFNDLEQSQYHAYDCDNAKTVDKGRGRVEIRECWTISGSTVSRHLRGFERWSHLQTASRIRSQRHIGDEMTCEDRYHLATIIGSSHVLGVVRAHWGIENELHWTLDIAFDEDRCRVRKDHGPENLALLRHLALNLLKHEKTCHRSSSEDCFFFALTSRSFPVVAPLPAMSFGALTFNRCKLRPNLLKESAHVSRRPFAHGRSSG